MRYKLSSAQRSISLELTLGGSKSESNRALIIRALCAQPFQINHLSDAQDTETLLSNLQAIADGKTSVDVGPAGTNMRFLTALLSIRKGTTVLTGDARMKDRPIGILVDSLRAMGAKIEYLEKEGYPPLQISGSALQGGVLKVNPSQSSQFISALLMIAPLLQEGLTLVFEEEAAVSESYISMTLQLMEYFGVRAEFHKGSIAVPPQHYVPRSFSVGADWSSASYWYEVLAFCDFGSIFLKGLYRNGRQGDQQIAEWMQEFGIETKDYAEGVLLEKKTGIEPPAEVNWNCKTCPDLVPALAVIAAGCGVRAHFEGIAHLRIKESDRIAALSTELQKLGLNCQSGKDYLTIQPLSNLQSLEPIQTYKDHRMAMAFAPLALKLPAITIADPAVVVKSYPSFWDDLRSAGFQLEEQN